MSETPYLRLVHAASQVAVDENYRDLIDKRDLPALRHLVQKNHHALSQARSVLLLECRIELVYEVDFFAKNSPNMQHLSNLARAFSLEGHLAGLEQRYGETVGVGLDLLELANAVGRGGLLCDHMVGWVVAIMGIDLLRRWRSEYDEVSLSQLLVHISRIEAERDDWAEVIKRDRRWEETVEHPEEPFDLSTIELSEEEKQNMSEQEISEYYQMIDLALNMPVEEREYLQHTHEKRVVSILRMMTIDTAIRVFRIMTGNYPRQLTDLTPGVLPQLPLDPFTGGNFVYHPQFNSIFRRAINNFLLYSPGPSQRDHGGTFGPYPRIIAGEADLCLDEADYWSDD